MVESEEKIEKIEFIISLCFRTVKNTDGQTRKGQVVTARWISFENIDKSDLVALLSEEIGVFMAEKSKEINEQIRKSPCLIPKENYALVQSHSVVKL